MARCFYFVAKRITNTRVDSLKNIYKNERNVISGIIFPGNVLFYGGGGGGGGGRRKKLTGEM